jgi:hypothetical protein
MQGADFLKALLALRAYRDAGDQGLNGMLAVCFVYRNRMQAGWWGGQWKEILEHHAEASAYTNPETNGIPDPRVYSFQCLLQEIDGIFNGTRVDDISSPPNSILANPPKPLYFAKLDKIDREWFLTNISRNPEHKRMSQVGGLTLFS